MTKGRGLSGQARSVVEGLSLKRWELGALTAVCALAFSMEQADTGVLQSMYGPIARGLGCTAVQIGTLTTWRGVVQVRQYNLLVHHHALLVSKGSHEDMHVVGLVLEDTNPAANVGSSTMCEALQIVRKTDTLTSVHSSYKAY